MRRQYGVIGLLVCVCAWGAPGTAHAQWFGAAYLGANKTQDANVSLVIPTQHMALTFHDVQFEGKSWGSPQYFGWRVGRLFGEKRRWGVELEYIHTKIYAKTLNVYAVTGELGAADPLFHPAPGVTETPVMDAIVRRYSMSHGLNFWLANLVSRWPLGTGPVTLIARVGAGPTRPHSETTVLGENFGLYQYAGMGGHAAAGLDVRMKGKLSLFSEYKFTYAQPTITVAFEGTGRMHAATHQVAVGLAFGLAR